MIVARRNNVKRIPPKTKLEIGLQAISRKQPIVNIAQRYDCSRTTVYKQQEKIIQAANQAYEAEDDDILFYIPVTKPFIQQLVVGLFLICKSSYRDIMFFLKDIIHYDLSIGSVFNILDASADKAILLNQSYDLSKIIVSAADEAFHKDNPILGVVDIASRFCALLAKADQRDYETWAIHLFDMQAQGYAPETTILDGAKGLTKGHEEALPNTKIQYDHFHIIRDMKDCERFLKNQVASAVTAALKYYNKADNQRDEIQKNINMNIFSVALAELDQLEDAYNQFKLLSQWLQYDVLQLAGHSPEVRAILYDFIVSEMSMLAVKHPHRISEILTSLNNQRGALLDVANALDNKFSELAAKYNQSVETVWSVCYVARYDCDSMKYNNKSSALEAVVGSRYDELENEVLFLLETTHRCSSMVENLNSRLRPYLDERKIITQKILALIQFYLNHKPFMRSKHEHMIDKTPAEIMTGKPHKPWLEMLGFTRNINQAA
jgi:Transposase